MNNFYAEKDIKITILVFVAFALASCSGSEGKLKSSIIASARGSRTKDVSLNLAEVAKDIEKICIQTPYLPLKDMEERAGEKLPGFRELDDTQFALWLFWKNQPPRNIVFNRRELGYRQQPFVRCSAGALVRFEEGQLYLVGERGEVPAQRGRR